VGSTHRDWPTSASVAYVNRVFEDYLAYGNLRSEDIRDKVVLELGPGDNLGVALRFLSAGASKVVCVDKFYSVRDRQQERIIYQALRDQCSAEERKQFDAAIDLERGIATNPERLEYRFGLGVEELGGQLGASEFDFIVSRAVLMEIHDPDKAFSMLDRLLRPGGWMIHKIAPLHDHGMFSQNGYHPLEFLTISDFLYEWMTCDSGKPNRRLMNYYEAKMAELSYTAKFQITRLLGLAGQDLPPGTLEPPKHSEPWLNAQALVHAIRPRILPRYRILSDRELTVEDFFLAAQKPGRQR
jgi:SAM-dependent methyltransferase